MSNQGICKGFTASGAISAFRIVKPAGARIASQAAAATDKLLGVTQELAAADTERLDVQLTGIGQVTAGAAFNAGDNLTSDASGRAIVAAPAAGANVNLIGRAIDAASAAGDVVSLVIAPSVMQG